MGVLLIKRFSLLLISLLIVTIFSLFYALATEEDSSNNITLDFIVEEKIHKELKEEILDGGKVDVILEIKNNPNEIIDIIEKEESKAKKSRDDNLIFAEIKSEEFNQIALDPNIERIWLDRKTKTFLDNSVEQINAHKLWSEGFNGSGIKIAILDTGIDKSHEMLSGKVILEKDFTDGDDPKDYYGHGTHVAGIATGNGGLYTGVAPGALILNGKVLDDSGRGRLSWLIDGIEWALDPDDNPDTDDGADIISLSLGAIYNENPEELLNSPEVLKVEEAINRGVIVVIASGNCADGCGDFRGVTTPGISRNAITVGAVDDNNEWLDFSSGDTISDFIKPDLVAPGEDICSSVPGTYDCLTGTSMSAPHVSGAVALLLSKEPNLDPHTIKNTFEKGALDLGDAGKDVKYGSGLMDLSKVDTSGGSFNNKNYRLEIPNFGINKEDEIKLVYLNKISLAEENAEKPRISDENKGIDSPNEDIGETSLRGVDGLSEISIKENSDDPKTENLEISNVQIKKNDERLDLSDDRFNNKKKIRIIFEIEELDDVVTVEKEKVISSGKSEEFGFKWTPYFIGKHLLKISIFENGELTNYFEVGVDVGGIVVDRLDGMEVLL